MEIILLHWRRKVRHHHTNAGFISKLLPVMYSLTYIGYNYFMLERLSQVFVLSIYYTNKYHYFVVFLYSCARFGRYINPPSLLIALSSDDWSRIYLKIINPFPSVSNEFRINCATCFDDNYTPSSPGNTALYTPVFNISLVL